MLSDDDKKLWLRSMVGVRRLKSDHIIVAVPPAKSRSYPEHKTTPFSQKESIKSTATKPDGIDAVIDLHGLTVQNAFIQFNHFLENCFNSSKRRILVITGKGSEEHSIKRELIFWTSHPKARSFISSFREADRHHGGAGAYYIFVKKK